MKVYVETNFILELALEQEQSASCSAILELCREGRLNLAIPAVSLVEPFTTLNGPKRRRRRLGSQLEDELRQMLRSDRRRQELGELRQLASRLVEASQEDLERLAMIREQVLELAQVIPADAALLRRAVQYQNDFRLETHDSIILASVLTDLESEPSPSYFLNRDRDFGLPLIVIALERLGCRTIDSFEEGARILGTPSSV